MINVQQYERELAERGVHFMRSAMIPPSTPLVLANDELKAKLKTLAHDAQVQMTTVPNSGVPAILTTWVDPKWIEILFGPLKAAEYLGESKLGDWAMDTAMFKLAEPVGEMASYGDFSNDGMSDFNTEFPQRQNYRAQTIIKYGDLEQARGALAQFNVVDQKRKSALNTVNRFINNLYLYGVSGLRNYGILNDPSLTAPITPSATFATAAPDVIFNNIITLFRQLVLQTGGLIDSNSKLKLAVSNYQLPYFANTNTYGLSALQKLKVQFPNLEFVEIPQLSTSSGELMQLMAPELLGDEVATACYSERFRAHPVIPEYSAWGQKISAGGWGAVLKNPSAVAQMLD